MFQTEQQQQQKKSVSLSPLRSPGKWSLPWVTYFNSALSVAMLQEHWMCKMLVD